MDIIKVKTLRSVKGPVKEKRKATDWMRIYRARVDEGLYLNYKDFLRFNSKIGSGCRILDARRQPQICHTENGKITSPMYVDIPWRGSAMLTAIKVTRVSSASGQGHPSSCEDGSHVAQVYAIGLFISKALVAYPQIYAEEALKEKIRVILVPDDQPLLVTLLKIPRVWRSWCLLVLAARKPTDKLVLGIRI